MIRPAVPPIEITCPKCLATIGIFPFDTDGVAKAMARYLTHCVRKHFEDLTETKERMDNGSWPTRR